MFALFGHLIRSAWKSPKPQREWSQDFAPIAPWNRAIETTDKANAFFKVGLAIKPTDEHPDYPALVLANYPLGGRQKILSTGQRTSVRWG